MGLFSLFRRRPPVRDVADLADFIDQNAALLVQRGIYEYSRARSGHYAKVLFREPGFLEAVEQSRWRAYPLGLAMVGEMVNGILRPLAPEDPGTVADAVEEMVLAVFDRYQTPAALGPDVWMAARRALAQRLGGFRLHRPKRAMDIPEPYADSYFALMPIYEKLRAPDHPTLRNYLRVSMCNIHDELIQRIDPRAMAESLRTSPRAG